MEREKEKQTFLEDENQIKDFRNEAQTGTDRWSSTEDNWCCLQRTRDEKNNSTVSRVQLAELNIHHHTILGQCRKTIIPKKWNVLDWLRQILHTITPYKTY